MNELLTQALDTLCEQSEIAHAFRVSNPTLFLTIAQVGASTGLEYAIQQTRVARDA